MVFFETAKRLLESLTDMLGVFGERKIEIARELTKIHEEIIRTSLSEVVTVFQEKTAKGEIVLIVEGASEKAAAPPESVGERVRSLAEQLGISTSEAVKLVAAEKGIRKQDVYRELLERKKPNS